MSIFGISLCCLIVLFLILFYVLYSRIIVNDQLYIGPSETYVKVIYKTPTFVTLSTTEEYYDVDTLSFIIFYRKYNK